MNAPKCRECYENDKPCQTYKDWYKQVFVCVLCGAHYKKEDFEEIEFQWKTKPKEWESWWKSRIKELKKASKPKKPKKAK